MTRPDFRTVPTPDPPGSLIELRDALIASRVEWELGTLNGPPETVFGHPAHVAVWSGQVHILDAMAHEVRVFNQDGTFRRTFGGKGQGPNELAFPIGMAFTRAGQLMVGMAAGLKYFAPADSGYSLARTRRVDEEMPSPHDACILGNTVYVRSSSSRATGDLIFAVDSEGNGAGSFDSAYAYGTWLIQQDLSDGLIACVPDPPTIVSAFKFVPLIRAYFPDGRLRWTAHLADYRSLKWIERRRDVGITFGLDRSAPGDLVLTVTPGPPGAVLVQVARLGAASRERPGAQLIERVDTYVIAAATGDGVFVGSDLPRVLHADAERLWGLSGESVGYPKVVQLRYGG